MSTNTSSDSVLGLTTTNLLKCTAPLIKAKGAALMKRFHEILIQNHPIFTTIFPADSIKTDKQAAALSITLYQYALNCDKIAVLEHDISDICGMAVNLGMEDWQYPVFGEIMVQAISEVLGTDINEETIIAWTEAVGFLAAHFVNLSEEFKKNPYFRSWKLTDKTIQHLKSSAPEVKAKGVLIASKMYTILFSRYPVFKKYFPKENSENGKMIAVLPHALHAFALHCDNVVELEDTIGRIVHRHVNQGVQDWHYPLLEECLVEAINSVLGLESRPEVLQAWKEGFQFLANKIMKLEDIRRNNPIVQYNLTQEDVSALKSSAILFKTKGTEIITHFYQILYERYPVFKSMFKEENVSSGKQVQAMVVVLHKFAANCDDMEKLETAISHIVGRHVGRKLGVESWHYPLVGECLLEAIKVVLDDKATPAIITGWTNGYNFLSNHFIRLEEEFRQNPYYQTWELSPETQSIIRSSAKVIKVKGPAIASRLYGILFARYPVFKSMFPKENTQSGKMLEALPHMLVDFAMNCGNVSVLDEQISRVAYTHINRGVQDWHYPMLEECFREALSLILADAATPEVMEAWNTGFKFFANNIMKREDLKRNNPTL